MKYLAPLLCCLLLAACAQPKPRPPSLIGLPNPASVHCQTQGGSSQTQDTPEGQVSHCHLPSGEIIEEWELYRRDSRP